MAERRRRTVRRAQVVRTEPLAPEMLRVVFTGPDLAGLEDSAHTDRYVKLLISAGRRGLPVAVRPRRDP